MKQTIARYVLAGGASRRFGSDKALAGLGGRPMLARMLEVAGNAAKVAEGKASYTFVVGDAEKYGSFGAPCIADRWPGEGPLGGIVTALLHSHEDERWCEWNLIVSCDMPFLTAEWLTFLCERARTSDAQVMLAHSANGPEPLCACWRMDSCVTLKAAFERGVRKVTDGIALLRPEVLDERGWKRFDSSGRLFWNMNTPADYEEARRILEGAAGKY
jgi:molybdenum cofactor guanylyltransferase